MTEREKGGTSIPAGLFRASQLPAAPKPKPKPQDEQASGPFKSTLVGVPASRPPPPLNEPVLSPPRWEGASAYEGENAPEPRPSSIPKPPPESALSSGENRGESVRDSLERILDEALPVEPGAQARAGAESPLLGNASAREAAAGGDELIEIESVFEEQLDAYAEAVAEPRPMPIRSSLLPVPIPRSSVVNDRDAPPALAPVPGAPAPPVTPPRLVELSPSLRAEAAARGHAPRSVPRSPAGAAPATLPRAEPPREPSAAGSGLVFVGLMTLIAVGGWYITQGGFVPSRRIAPTDVSAPPALPRVPDAVRPGRLAEVPVERAPGVSAPTPEATRAPAPEAARVEAPAPPQALPPPPEEPTSRRRPRAQRSSPAASEPVPASPAPATAPAPAPAPAPKPALTIAPVAEPAAELPERPSRDAVQQALDAVRPALVECAQGRRGLAQADVTVAGSGKVTKAVVGGEFAGSPESACMARAVREARFSPFREATFQVVYPYRL